MDLTRPDISAEPTLTERCTEYQALIGKLLFLSICTRPDISYAMNTLAQHSSAPRQSCFDAIKWVVRYLKGTANLGLHYKAEINDFAPKGYSDSDWAGEKDRRSVSRYMGFYGKCLIDWGSKKQQCMALSSTEAEYVALMTCIQSGISLRSLAGQLKLDVRTPMPLKCDNQGAISLSSETSHHSHAKHIDIKYHFIRSHVNEGTFEVSYVKSNDNCADVLTKPLLIKSHQRMVGLLNLSLHPNNT
jgi:hypothetical protein